MFDVLQIRLIDLKVEKAVKPIRKKQKQWLKFPTIKSTCE